MKFLKVLLVVTLILILFRGMLFRLTIQYEEIGSRPAIELTDKALIREIEAASVQSEMDIKSISKIATKLTSKHLKFSTKPASNNPNELVHTRKANCVGYSALFNAIANHLIEKHNLQQEIEAEHKIGKLEFLGINLHQYFSNPFFKDHDFNILTNKSTGVQWYIDPSVSDYLWINRVSKK